jgi:hypothetical protein
VNLEETSETAAFDNVYCEERNSKCTPILVRNLKVINNCKNSKKIFAGKGFVACVANTDQ